MDPMIFLGGLVALILLFAALLVARFVIGVVFFTLCVIWAITIGPPLTRAWLIMRGEDRR